MLNFRQRRAKPPKDAEPGDQRHGDWTRERLLKMDARFQSALERAFKDGTEHRRSAATHGTISTRPRVHYVVTAKWWQMRLTRNQPRWIRGRTARYRSSANQVTPPLTGP